MMARAKDKPTTKSQTPQEQADAQRAALLSAVAATTASHPARPAGDRAGIRETEVLTPQERDETDADAGWGDNASDSADMAGPTGLERYRGPGRRLSDFGRAAEEGELTREQFMFVMAIDAFKKANGKTFPAWTDVLEVIRLLGYRKTCKSETALRSCEDWTEAADAPSNVRPYNWDKRAA